MATTGEVADPRPDEVAPYIEKVRDIAQVNVGDLVVVRPPYGNDKIQKVRGKEANYNGRGPAIDVGTFWVSLKPKRGDPMGAITLFRRPSGGAGPAAAGAGGPEGGKRRKTRKTKKARRKSTRRRWFY